MFGIKKRIMRKVKKDVLELLTELYNEHIKDSEIKIVPDIKNRGISIRLVPKGK